MNKNEIAHIKTLLSEPKKIAIVSHRNPDGDAYGSSLALYHYLTKRNHMVSVVSPNDCPDFLKWLPGQDKIVILEDEPELGSTLLKEAEYIFTLDLNALHRVGDAMEKVLNKVSAKFIMIDHHEQPDDYALYTYSDPSICSTSQMLYHFFEMLGEEESIDATMATCLYTGIVTDTGSFKYPSTTSTTHNIAAKLINLGINHTVIHNHLYDANSFARMQLLGKALSNIKVLNEYKTAYISLSQRELNSYNFKKGDTEGFVNYGLSIKDVVFAAIFIEDQKQKIIKISFRSKGSFSVNEFARKHFNGGGHDNAAGGRSDHTLRETISNFLKVLPNYSNELQNSYEE